MKIWEKIFFKKNSIKFIGKLIKIPRDGVSAHHHGKAKKKEKGDQL